MRASNTRGAAAALALALALTGCAPHQMAPKPTAPVDARSYDSLDALHYDFTSAGFDCPGWSPDNGMGLALESGSCSSSFVLATFADSDDESQAVENQALSTEESDLDSVNLVVGPNWFVNTWDDAKTAKAVQTYLGGSIRTFGKDDYKDRPDPFAGVYTDDPAPDGFIKSGDLFVKFGSNTSDSFEHTVTAEVWSSTMCSSVYLEANLLAADGTIIGYTNGSLGTLPAGTVGQVELNWTERGAETIRATKSSCE